MAPAPRWPSEGRRFALPCPRSIEISIEVTALLADRGQEARGYRRAGPAAVPEVIFGGKERTTFSQLPPASCAEGYVRRQCGCAPAGHSNLRSVLLSRSTAPSGRAGPGVTAGAANERHRPAPAARGTPPRPPISVSLRLACFFFFLLVLVLF